MINDQNERCANDGRFATLLVENDSNKIDITKPQKIQGHVTGVMKTGDIIYIYELEGSPAIGHIDKILVKDRERDFAYNEPATLFIKANIPINLFSVISTIRPREYTPHMGKHIENQLLLGLINGKDYYFLSNEYSEENKANLFGIIAATVADTLFVVPVSCPQTINDNDGFFNAVPDMELNIAGLSDDEEPDKKPILAVFTDWDSALGFAANGFDIESKQCAILSFDWLTTIMSHYDAMVVNAFNDNSITLPAELIEKIVLTSKGEEADFINDSQGQDEGTITVSKMAESEANIQIMEKARDFCKKNSSIKSLHMFNMMSDGVPSYLVVIDCPQSKLSDIIESFWSDIKELVEPQDVYNDMNFIQYANAMELMPEPMNDIAPVYVMSLVC